MVIYMKKYKAVFSIFMVIMAVCIITGCGEKATLTGKWSSVDGGSTIYEFNEDGTGIEKKGNEISMNITYTTNGNTITITKEILGQKQSEDYIYELELKKLKLTRNSNTVEFDKQ